MASPKNTEAGLPAEMHGTVYAALAGELELSGLILRGGFHPSEDNAAPALPDGQAAGTIIMVGNAGPGLWRAYAAEPPPPGPNPLDRWARARMKTAVSRYDGMVIMPNDGPPYWPFPAWAMHAEDVAPSPIGLLIHPVYGLWHAYRGALIFRDQLHLPPRPDRPVPCQSCPDSPCLSACPVDAFQADAGRHFQHYDVAECASFLAGDQGEDCLTRGCQARRACPVGADWAYATEQARYHMTAFLAARPGRQGR